MSNQEASTARQVLERALCLEIDGEAFYRQAAAKAQDPSGKRMFQDLAQQEAEHQLLIRRQLESLDASGQFAADERIRPLACDLSQSLFPQGEARARAIGPRANELEAIWYALGKESESYELYRQGAQQTRDPLARSLYQYLMAAERDHFNILMSNYEEIQKQQYRAGS
jgi:rubrerythrin